MWKDRRAMSDEALGEIVKHEGKNVYVDLTSDNHLYVLYFRGCPAGYAELNYRLSEEVELSYFGIIHEFVGNKLGPFLLHYVIQVAITDNLRKTMIVNTCTLDHPSALSTYQKAGFEAYKTEEKMEPVPEWFEPKL
jgi:GNAT superfamily N-acetyltransferase